MGFLSKYRGWRLGRNKAAVARYEAKSADLSNVSDISALVLADGFIPSVILSGETLEQLYEVSTWAFAAMSANAEGVASMPVIVQRRGSGPNEARWVADPDHPLNSFVRSPFGPGVEPRWTSQQLNETLSIQTDMCGNAYERIVPTTGPTQFYVQLLHPQDVKPISNGIRVVSYEYTPRSRGSVTGSFAGTAAGPVEIIPADQIIHTMMPAPGSQTSGFAPLRAALKSMEVDATALERTKANLRNRLGLGLIISFEQMYGVTEEQRTALETYLKESFQKAERDGSPLVLGSKAKVESVPNTIDQLAYFDVRKASREDILAVFKTPPQMLALYENATLQNVRQSRSIWWSSALEPKLQRIMWALNKQAVEPLFGPDVRVWFDVNDSEIGLEILEHKADVAKKLTDLGYSTNLANARVELGMPFVPELDTTNDRMAIAGRDTDEGAADSPEDDAEAEATPEPAAEAVNDE